MAIGLDKNSQIPFFFSNRGVGWKESWGCWKRFIPWGKFLSFAESWIAIEWMDGLSNGKNIFCSPNYREVSPIDEMKIRPTNQEL